MNPLFLKNNLKKIEKLLNTINDNALDCIGGKKIYIQRTDWREFEKLYNDLKNESKKNTPAR